MRYQATLFFALVLLWSPPCLAKGTISSTENKSSKTASTKVEKRHFSFPKEYSLGSLQMMGNEKAGTERRGDGIGTAQGSVTVDVPPGATIMLEINPHCLEHPERLKNIQTAGINRLKIAYLSMDDNDHSLCDKALQALPEFKDLISLNVERSDTSDKGLAGFKSLSSVKYLIAFGAALDGSFLKETQKLKKLEWCNLMFNPLKGENLKYLSSLPNLVDLVLNQSNLSDADLKNFPKCSQLKQLLLLDNPRITDKSLPVLRQQTALDILDVRGTGISLAGVVTLKNLKLTKLILPVKRYRPNEIAELKKAFPKAFFNYRGEGLRKEDQILLAPVK
jgi:hypothetical protein